MAVILKCPICEDKFKWAFAEKQKWPTHCPSCRERIHEDRADDDIVMPAFLSAKTKRADDCYRQLETTSEYRAEKAAEMAGCSTAEMSGLKITDIRTNTLPGEIAQPIVQNAVTERMDAMAARGLPTGFGAGPSGADYAPAVASGPAPNAGAMMHNIVRQTHALGTSTGVSEIGQVDHRGVPIKPRIPYTAARR